MNCAFQGVVWLGVKMVLIRISRMLRRWLPMHKLEELSSRPAQIEWIEEITMTLSSQLDPLFGAQSLTDARNEYHAAASCNEQLG
jgi:hypothetical protein